MGPESNTPSNREERLDEVICNYLKKVEEGQTPDHKEILDRHPDLTDDLARFFANRDRLNPFNTTLLPPVPTDPATQTDLASFGDYEVLEKIPGGGMSVVYKARQKSLKRLVALKMILPDRATSPADVQRIIQEAEDVAKLDHPNIVPIHEVNAHQGKPYFSMKFMEGGSLASRIDDFRLPHVDRKTRKDEQERVWTSSHIRKRQREIAGLVATIARAVHHAHQRGILHRDLKPGNVLLDAEGKPHVTDFGLAKRFEPGCAGPMREPRVENTEAQSKNSNGAATEEFPSVTHVTVSYLAPELATLSVGEMQGIAASGRVAGTVHYMAPEQARASRVLTTAVDVYGLGAVLYELLTGRPPFRASTPLETLLEVIEKEPVSPSKLNPLAHPDLEAICLTSLQKGAQDRYGSAEAFADELERFIRDEPVIVRPVGKLERLWRWGRRNRALAASLGAAVGALALGAIVATIFAFRAAASSEDAKNNLTRAESALTRLQQANTDILERDDRLETTLARSRFRPLGLQDPPLSNGPRSELWSDASTCVPLLDTEIDALWELAEDPGERLWYRFAEGAMVNRVSTKQLKNRAAFAWHAAAGLDRQKREKLDRLLRKRMEDVALDVDQRLDITIAAADLGDLAPDTQALVSETLTLAITETRRPDIVIPLAYALFTNVNRLTSPDADRAASRLTQAMTKMVDPRTIAALAKAVAKLAERLQGKEREKYGLLSARQIVEAIQKIDWRLYEESDPNAFAALVNALQTAAADLREEDADKLVARLTIDLPPIGVKGRFPGDEPWQRLGAALRVLAPRCGSQALRSAVRIYIDLIKSERNRDVLEAMTHEFVGMADRLQDEEAATHIIQAMKTTDHPPALLALAQGFSKVAARIQDTNASGFLREAIFHIAKVFETVHQEQTLRQALLAVVGHVKTKDTAFSLTQMMRESNDFYVVTCSAEALAVVAAGLNADDAATCCGEAATWLNQTVKRNTRPDDQILLAQSLSALASGLPPKDAAKLLCEAMEWNTQIDGLKRLAQALALAANRLDATDAASCADRIVLAMEGTIDANELAGLAEGLSAVVGRLEASDAARFSERGCARVGRALDLFTELEALAKPKRLIVIAQAFSAVAGGLSSTDAARLASRLTVAMDTTKDAEALEALANALSAVVRRLGSAEASRPCARAFARLTEVIKETDPSDQIKLTRGMSAIAEYMEPADAASCCGKVAARLSRQMAGSNFAWSLQGSADALWALDGHLDAVDATHYCEDAADLLIEFMIKETARTDGTKDTARSEVRGLAQALRGLPPRLGARNATVASHRLIEAIKRTRDPDSLQSLAWALSAVARRVDTKEVGASLILAIHETANPVARQRMAQILTVVLNQSEDCRISAYARNASASIALLAGLNQPLGQAMLFASVPLSKPLSPQFLIDLLKQPVCVGSARRAVLDALEVHFSRSFADQWDFVRFAEENDLGLDVTSPPKRSSVAKDPTGSSP
jgi:serine/threonine protein kinase